MCSPDISLCIASYNEAPWLARLLQSLGPDARPKDIEVVVADSCSTDDTVAMLGRDFPWVKCLVTDFNGGYSTAINCAIRHTTGPFVVAANADIELTWEALRALRDTLQARPEAFGCAPRLLNPDGTPQPSSAYFPTLGRLLAIALKGARFLEPVPAAGDPFPIQTCAGACVMYRRERVEDVGLLDERFFLYFEEVDLHQRLYDRGGCLLAVPQTAVIHHGGKSTGGETRLNLQRHLVSLFYYIQKHHGAAAETAARLIMAGGYLGRLLVCGLASAVRAGAAVGRGLRPAPHGRAGDGEPALQRGALGRAVARPLADYAALLHTCLTMWRETERGIEPRA